METGEVLAARRRALGWTQRAVGRRAGVHYSDVSRLEHGERSLPEQTGRVAQALGLDPATLAVLEPVPAAPALDLLGDLDALLERGGYADGVRRALVDLAGAVGPGPQVARLMGRLFPSAEWSPGGREAAEQVIRAEWARAQAWPARIESAYEAASAPMAASEGVPDGATEERIFLRRMERALEGAS